LNSVSTGEKQTVVFDDSGLEASLDFLRNRSDQNLQEVIAAPGNKLAYTHYLWSHYNAKLSEAEFWHEQLSGILWSAEFEHNINSVRKYLLKQGRAKWLKEVLRYLPRRHFFNTTVCLNLGYDHIVFGENVALNINSRQFGVDKRESIYYLIHELAHAGYVRYHSLPNLWTAKTNGELVLIVRFLTHLEGMGVLSALRLRIAEHGLLDNDYRVLLNDGEKIKRVRQYFKLLVPLEKDPEEKIEGSVEHLYNMMSGRKTRLWYITGCHMAQEIEKHLGLEPLRNLVKQGSAAFFNTYLETAHP